MPTAYINIGSNMGDRATTIECAVAHIEHLCGTTAQCAPIIESEPWGFDSTNSFLNLGIAISTDLSPLTLLHALQSIEQQIASAPHRDDKGNYIDRIIDIDLIAVDDIVVDYPELILPHPRMHLRKFVLTPMMTLAPDWIHPILHATAAELLSRIERTSQSI